MDFKQLLTETIELEIPERKLTWLVGGASSHRFLMKDVEFRSSSKHEPLRYHQAIDCYADVKSAAWIVREYVVAMFDALETELMSQGAPQFRVARLAITSFKNTEWRGFRCEFIAQWLEYQPKTQWQLVEQDEKILQARKPFPKLGDYGVDAEKLRRMLNTVEEKEKTWLLDAAMKRMEDAAWDELKKKQ